MFRPDKAKRGESQGNPAVRLRGFRFLKVSRPGSAVTAAAVAILATTLLFALAGCSDSPSSAVVVPGASGVASSLDTITVIGNATVKSAPDEAVLTLTVESDGKDPAAAMNRNASSVSDVIERVKREGVKEEDIKTANVSVYAIRTYTETGQEKLTGYRAANGILVTVSDAKQVGKILSAAIEAGANNVSGPVWQLSDDTEVVAEALKQAAQNARVKAEALADSLGVDVGDVVMMNESGVQVPVYPLYADMYAGKGEAAGIVAETPISAGTLDVTATVTVTFALRR